MIYYTVRRSKVFFQWRRVLVCATLKGQCCARVITLYFVQHSPRYGVPACPVRSMAFDRLKNKPSSEQLSFSTGDNVSTFPSAFSKV